MPLQRNLGVDEQRRPHQLERDMRVVAADHAGRFELANARETCAGRQRNARGQGLIREPSFALQRLQDLQVGAIQILHVQNSLL
jgi:hypothetical protein